MSDKPAVRVKGKHSYLIDVLSNLKFCQYCGAVGGHYSIKCYENDKHHILSVVGDEDSQWLKREIQLVEQHTRLYEGMKVYE